MPGGAGTPVRCVSQAVFQAQEQGQVGRDQGGARLVEGRIEARSRFHAEQIGAGCSCRFEAEPEPPIGELLSDIDRGTAEEIVLPVTIDEQAV